MPLVKCPMCEKMISPNAESCPNCGEPMKKDKDDDKYSIVLEKSDPSKIIQTIRMIRMITNCDLNTGKNMVNSTPISIINNIDLEKAKNLIEEIRKETSEKTQVNYVKTNEVSNYIAKTSSNLGKPNTIKCSNCKSEKVHKISGLSKVGSAAMFGIFSIGKLNKTYECDSCGYRW